MYASLIIKKWKNSFECKNNPYPINFDVNSYGFLEVFATLEDLQKEYPNQELVGGIDYLRLIEKD